MTRDVGIAAALSYAGIREESLWPDETGVITFVYADSAHVRAIVDKYTSNMLMVDARTFVQHMKLAKRVIAAVTASS